MVGRLIIVTDGALEGTIACDGEGHPIPPDYVRVVGCTLGEDGLRRITLMLGDDFPRPYEMKAGPGLPPPDPA